MRSGHLGRRTAAYTVALAGPPAVAAALHPLARGDQATNVAFAFLLVVLAAAALDGLAPGLLASVAAFAAFNLVFVEPHGRLTVAARRDVGVLAGFLVSALVVSALVARLAARREQAERQAEESRLLYLLGETADVAGLAAFATALLGAREVAVSAGEDVLLGDPGAVRAAPGAVVATAPLASGAPVAVVATGVRHRPLLDAVAARVAATIDRDRLLAESRERELLEQTERQRRALVSAVSHDLRTPLSAIKASAAALTQPDVGAPARAELAASIGVEVDRLDRIVRNLLDLGRIESGRLVARPEPIPVDELVGSVLARLRPHLRERRVEISVPSDLPPALVDPVQGAQVVANLVENVIAHTPLNAGLIVRAAARDGRVTLRVADEGPGIPEHEHARVFERFARGPGAGPGSGLGLAIARAYAEANGGGLAIAPSGGVGTAFELWLPVAS